VATVAAKSAASAPDAANVQPVASDPEGVEQNQDMLDDDEFALVSNAASTREAAKQNGRNAHRSPSSECLNWSLQHNNSAIGLLRPHTSPPATVPAKRRKRSGNRLRESAADITSLPADGGPLDQPGIPAEVKAKRLAPCYRHCGSPPPRVSPPLQTSLTPSPCIRGSCTRCRI
jgi:hypothetical protein